MNARKTVIVTGAGTGIGKATALRFARDGYDVVLNGRRAEALAEALTSPGPCLIHASIDAEQKVYPMVPPGAANRDMIGA